MSGTFNYVSTKLLKPEKKVDSVSITDRFKELHKEELQSLIFDDKNWIGNSRIYRLAT